MWTDLETVIQNEISHKGKNKYRILMHKMVQFMAAAVAKRAVK